MVARPKQAGSALLVVILITFLGAVACQAWYQVLAAGLTSLRREEEQVRLTALADAAVAITLAHCGETPDYAGFASRLVGSGMVSADVRREEDGSLRVIVKVSRRGSERILRVRIQRNGESAEVVGWEVASGGAPADLRQRNPQGHSD